MGAGILPIALHRGTLFVLLGQERHNNLLCDFGGGAKHKESVFDTAVREGYEELNGILGNEDTLKKKINNNLIYTLTYDKYTSYIFKVNYDKNLPIYFNNFNKFAEDQLKDKIDINHNGLFEKNEINWYKLTDFKSNKNIKKLRPHYVNILNCLVNKERYILNEFNNIDKVINF